MKKVIFEVDSREHKEWGDTVAYSNDCTTDSGYKWPRSADKILPTCFAAAAAITLLGF